MVNVGDDRHVSEILTHHDPLPRNLQNSSNKYILYHKKRCLPIGRATIFVKNEGLLLVQLTNAVRGNLCTA
jgi:hypothetical protein